MDVVVTHIDAHGVSGNGHAFNHDVGIELHDVAVFASTRFTFVRIANQILLTGELTGHETPLQTCRKTSTTTAAQGRLFDSGNDLVLRQAFAAIFAQYFAQGLVTTARFVIFEAPVSAIQTRHDLRVNVTLVERGFHACGHKARQQLIQISAHAAPPDFCNVSTNSSSFSLLMKLHMVRSLTSSTGASAQAPWHSLGCKVMRPSGVVSPD